MRSSQRGSRKGFTLLEMLAFMGALTAAMLVGGALLNGALQTERAAATAHQRLVQRTELAKQFRDDVSRAVNAPDSFTFGEEKETAGPSCLILARADKREVVYLWGGGELWRWERAGDKLPKRELKVGADCKGIEFVRGAGDHPLVTMRLKLGGPKSKTERPIELSAVLGGDLR